MAKSRKIAVVDGTIPIDGCQIECAADDDQNVCGIWLHVYVPSEMIPQLPKLLRNPATMLVYDIVGKTIQ